jgi:hypothetical protein
LSAPFAFNLNTWLRWKIVVFDGAGSSPRGNEAEAARPMGWNE